MNASGLGDRRRIDDIDGFVEGGFQLVHQKVSIFNREGHWWADLQNVPACADDIHQDAAFHHGGHQIGAEARCGLAVLGLKLHSEEQPIRP